MTYEIDDAVNAFRALLEEQLQRQKRLGCARAVKDYSALPTLNVGLIDGDGIGPVIMRTARAALEKLLCGEIARGSVALRSIDGLTIERRLACGQSVPDEALRRIKACDVLLKGPTTTPHGGGMESANVTLRRELDLYANVRPVRVPEKKIDWIFFRENSEGEYVLGSRGIMPNAGLAVDFKVITEEGTGRIARAAFEYAKNNGKKSVTVVTKANILKKTDGLFSKVAHRVGADYPDIEIKDRYIDIMTAELINDETASSYEVFLLPNLYGDILTDEAAQIAGGVGTAGSSNIGTDYAMFEAIHGSAPRLIEEGLGEYASPVSILRAASLLLRHIGRADKAEKLDRAVDETQALCPVNGTKKGYTCRQFEAELLKKL